MSKKRLYHVIAVLPLDMYYWQEDNDATNDNNDVVSHWCRVGRRSLRKHCGKMTQEENVYVEFEKSLEVPSPKTWPWVRG